MSQHFDQHAATWDDDPAKTRRAICFAEAICAGVPVHRGMPVLEYGCGTGLLSFALAPQVGPITAADSSPGMLEVLRRKIAARPEVDIRPSALDLLRDGLPPERYGLICSLMTLHHIDDTAAILRAFHDLLDDNGHLCIADLDSEDGSFHAYDFNGHKGFDRVALGELCRAAGFAEVDFSTVFEIEKTAADGVMRRYPVFFLRAGKRR